MSGEFVLRRKAWVMKILMPLLRVVALYHRLVVEGTEHLPRQGPALLLVKHRATRDTLLLSLILDRFAHRSGNYLMKGKPSVIFNGILEAAGGIKVIRPKDIHRLESRAAQKACLEQARTLNQHALDYITWLYTQGEIVITFPEGMFYPHRIGVLQTGIIKHTWQVEQKNSLQIPLIPIGIEYESLFRPRAQAFFRIGPPLYAGSYSSQGALIRSITQCLAKLSGFAADSDIQQKIVSLV